MPIRASDCDQMYLDCKDDTFGIPIVDGVGLSIYDWPAENALCSRMSDIYPSAKDMCNNIW
jgi:hypothetical protein